MSFLGLTSPRYWGSEVSCPEDPFWLEPSTPGLRVKHFTTESRWKEWFEFNKKKNYNTTKIFVVLSLGKTFESIAKRE